MATKKIKLGVREYNIPELAIRQRRVVVPLGIKLRSTMMRLKEESSISSLTTQEMTDLQEVVYQGCSRAEPKLEREAFFDFVFDEIDLVNAFAVILQQAGFESRQDSMGEAKGEAAPSIPPTGTPTTTT